MSQHENKDSAGTFNSRVCLFKTRNGTHLLQSGAPFTHYAIDSKSSFDGKKHTVRIGLRNLPTWRKLPLKHAKLGVSFNMNYVWNDRLEWIKKKDQNLTEGHAVWFNRIQKKLCNHVIYIINIEIHTKSPTALAHVKAY